jgi:hypothetical protein
MGDTSPDGHLLHASALRPLLRFVGDVRSDKVEQLLANPRAEICWWLPVTREQYRFKSKIHLLISPHSPYFLPLPHLFPDLRSQEEERKIVWNHRISETTKATFNWPYPGMDVETKVRSKSPVKREVPIWNGASFAKETPRRDTLVADEDFDVEEESEHAEEMEAFEHMVVIIAEPTSVERLVLDSPVHTRARWQRVIRDEDEEWEERQINP